MIHLLLASLASFPVFVPIFPNPQALLNCRTTVSIFLPFLYLGAPLQASFLPSEGGAHFWTLRGSRILAGTLCSSEPPELEVPACYITLALIPLYCDYLFLYPFITGVGVLRLPRTHFVACGVPRTQHMVGLAPGLSILLRLLSDIIELPCLLTLCSTKECSAADRRRRGGEGGTGRHWSISLGRRRNSSQGDLPCSGNFFLLYLLSLTEFPLLCCALFPSSHLQCKLFLY